MHGKPQSIKNLSVAKIIEILTSPNLEYPDIFDIVLYGYRHFTSTKTLFRELLKRFRISAPPGMSPAENDKYCKQFVKIIQIRVLIFLQFWRKIYLDPSLHGCMENEEMFMEALFIIYLTKKKGSWVNLSLNKLLLSMEEL